LHGGFRLKICTDGLRALFTFVVSLVLVEHLVPDPDLVDHVAVGDRDGEPFSSWRATNSSEPAGMTGNGGLPGSGTAGQLDGAIRLVDRCDVETRHKVGRRRTRGAVADCSARWRDPRVGTEPPAG
jgi:hypothetical protein